MANTGSASDNILRKEQSIQEIRLRPDIYYIEKARKKTDAVIFSNHEQTTLNMTVRISDYLDRIWGSKNDTFSMYYLNGQDNSLILNSCA